MPAVFLAAGFLRARVVFWAGGISSSMTASYKLPRLYVETLQESGGVLSEAQNHYLRNVLRLEGGGEFRVFHPQRGEFSARLSGGKKDRDVALGEKLRDPFEPTRHVHLYAPPLAKDRMDFLIEKSVELGVTDFHPLLSAHTQIHKVNEDRLRAQMVEAAEQSERMDIPMLHKTATLQDALVQAPRQRYAAIERFDASPVQMSKEDIAVFIGPPGGWSEKERDLLHDKAIPLSLGETVLRSETAALAALVKLTQ